MSSTIYLIVKESGEYSQWDKENLAYFDNLEEAEKYVAFLTERHELSTEREVASFSVETIKHGELPENASDLLSQDRIKKIIHDNNEKVEYDRKRAEWEQRDATKKADAFKALTEEVRRFLDWWSAGPTGDQYFEEKRTAMLRSIKQPLTQYICQTNDKRAVDWMASNSGLFA